MAAPCRQDNSLDVVALRVLRCLFFMVLALLLAIGLAADDARLKWDFDLIRKQAGQLYGASDEALERLSAWEQLLQAQLDEAELEQLRAINYFFNLRLRFRDDHELWLVEDYWATPVEALFKGGADCEDFAIAKYFSLRQLGVPSDKLRITYVKATQLNQAHMVLTYYEHPAAVPLVLDNLIDAILPADQRSDLVPVYAFNAEGLWLPGSGGGRQLGDSKGLSRWQDLLKKMHAEGFP